MFKGSITALITPFDSDGQVDARAYQDFIAWQIGCGTNAVVPCGTTGESPTLTLDEHHRVIELCIEVAKGKIPVIAGTGSNCTATTIEITRHAQKAGADAALIVTPYYNKPTQEGLYRHYKAVAESTDLPIILYNVPGRTGADLNTDTVARLAKIPNIVGIKDATADLARPLRLRQLVGSDFCQLSGEDATVVAFLAQGGHGCISVSSNVAPNLCAELHKAWQRGDWQTVEELRDILLPIHDAMFVETSPMPVKYAASLLGKCLPLTRAPLCELSDAGKAKVRVAMAKAGIIG